MSATATSGPAHTLFISTIYTAPTAASSGAVNDKQNGLSSGGFCPNINHARGAEDIYARVDARRSNRA